VGVGGSGVGVGGSGVGVGGKSVGEAVGSGRVGFGVGVAAEPHALTNNTTSVNATRNKMRRNFIVNLLM